MKIIPIIIHLDVIDGYHARNLPAAKITLIRRQLSILI